MKYHFYINVTNHDLKHAGSKAVDDCTNLLKLEEYKLIQFDFYKHRYLNGFNVIKLIFQLAGLIGAIKPDSLIVIQYPLYGLKSYFRFFLKALKLKKCYFVCVIHDLNSLRYQRPQKEIDTEIGNLNAYDVLISHNEHMTTWLTSNGINTKIIDLQLFDYLSSCENTFDRVSTFKKGRREIVFAGNLSRGEFLYQLKDVAKKDVSFKLYGPGLDIERLGQAVKWEGIVPADILVEKLQGNFGLIWDGDDIGHCGGQYGDYISYNNPHKISLYLAAGLPVILPKKAALSSFVIANNVGVAVDSLYELSDMIDKIDPDQYKTMISNVASISSRLRNGNYFKSAIKKVELLYEGQVNEIGQG